MMDRINVSDDGLRMAYQALDHFQENTKNITALCSDLLTEKKALIDDTFRQDLMAYVETLKAWNSRINTYANENKSAIGDRLVALEDYCATTYIKRSY